MKDAPQDLQNHPMYSQLDYEGLRNQGYTNDEIKAFFDRMAGKPQVYKTKEETHDELIASIRAKLAAITTLIDREAQRDNYNWSDIGDLGYIDERLQEIVDFRNDL